MIGLLAFLLPLTLFLGLPSTLWNFDGVACAAALELGRPDYLFHANHLLYGFFGYVFWRFLGAPLGILRALPALQLFGSLLSAAGLVGLYKVLARLMDLKYNALTLTLSLMATAAFWVWSIEAQVYPLGFLALAWATVLLTGPDRPHKYLGVGLLHGGAVLGHQMHFLWIVPALYWMSRDTNCDRTQWKIYLGVLAATILIPYGVVVGAVIAPGRTLGSTLIWLKGSAGLTPDRHWAWHFPGWTGPWTWIKSTAPMLWGSFWPYGTYAVPHWIWFLTLASLIVWVVILRGRRQLSDPINTFACLWIMTYGLFLSTWEPATLCYRMTDIIPVGILLATGLRTFRPLTQVMLVSVLLITTLTVNLTTRIGPMHRLEENRLYQDTLALSKITAPDSLYITQGGSPWIYLLYFTGRNAWNAQTWDPQRLQEELTQQKKHRRIYILKESLWEAVL